MPTFSAPDATTLAFHVTGDGDPVICLPGGPMRASTYLGDLGGLGAYGTLIMLDLRGTGESAVPADSESYRCDRLVDDVEALREHLGLDRMTLLGHSAGTNLAARYVERHPQRVGKLALITPSVRALDIQVTGDMRREAALLRRDEPWFPVAYAALERVTAGSASEDDWDAVTPFFYGRWDETISAYHDAGEQQRNDDAAAAFFGEGAFDPDGTRAAFAEFASPVLVLAGEVDLNSPPSAMAEVAGLFPRAELVVQPGAGHFPWLDDPARFTSTLASFLDAS